MFFAGLFLAAFAQSLASPIPVTVPGSTIPSPVCIVAAAITASRCDPTQNRTIFDILYSCIGVILLCTYISIHHNIPDQEHSWAKVTWLKLRTTLYALIAPEAVIMWAIRQRVMAGRIARENKHRGWTITHGFFVQMGGLMQRKSDSTYEVLYYDWSVARASIPHIPVEEIMDHGKGDLLAKAVVVVQTTWFVAQCIARHVQGLTLTEIELVTLAFATLNVITYGLWWSKPLNIGYPIYFDENGVRVDGPLAPASQPEGNADGSQAQAKESREGISGLKGAWRKTILGALKGIWKGMKEYATGWGKAFQNIWVGAAKSWQDSLQRRGVVKTIWKKAIAAPFSAVFGSIVDMMDEQGLDNRPTSVHPFCAAPMPPENRALAALCGSTIGIVFGAIHLIAWNFQFPTIIELWLWRSCSLVLTIIPLNLAVGFAFDIVYEGLGIKILEYVAGTFLYPTMFLGVPLYFAARIVLLFLAFFTLRDLPDSAYQNVRWTEFLPHI
ncbi:hypothetical protein AX16_001627 [Volvariella volvacea WC 439]|nr:hypothetical protein AX16_001627 [Volvariella volvacea WC 439]